MLHTIISTNVVNDEEKIKELLIVFKKAVVLWWKELMKYFDFLVKDWWNDELLNIREEAEKRSGKIIMEIIQWSNFFSILDIKTEKHRKDTKISENSKYSLIVDSLDWRNNFRLWIPNFSVSIAMLKGSEIILWVVYNPIMDILFFAEKWKWAYKNWKKIMVNNQSKISESTISYLHEYRSVPQTVKHNILWDFIKINLKRFLVERSPANDFCLLADWKIEWIICNQESIYDFCAWKLIAKEAWALITNLKDNNLDTNNFFVISNSSQEINKQLYDIFSENVW